MKKLLVFWIIGIIFFGACSAQNADAQSSNDAQRIVGTWRTVSGSGNWTITGTFTNDTFNFVAIDSLDGERRERNGKYFISSNGNLILNINNTVTINNYYLSTNGRILVMTDPVLERRVWLDKQ